MEKSALHKRIREIRDTKMKHFIISFKPDGKQISIHSGATLMEAAGQAGIILNTFCGGKGTCKKCLVNIEPSGREVLACQYRINSDLTVTIPQQSRFFEQKILTRGIDKEIEGTPVIYQKYLTEAAEDKIFGLPKTKIVRMKAAKKEKKQEAAEKKEETPKSNG